MKHEGETHSDIEAVYHFECDAPGKLTQLTVELFEAFPGMEELKVQYVIESKQGAAELTASQSRRQVLRRRSENARPAPTGRGFC
jgi:hypothetical protein